MRKIFIVLAAVMSFSASADTCRVIGNIAEAIMGARQNGASVSDMVDATQGNKLAMALVLEAFKEPRYESYEYQRKAVLDFTNAVQLECYK